MGMPATVEVPSLDTATSAAVATDVSAKLVATASDGIGPVATFVTHGGLTLGKVRPRKAEEAMLRFRARVGTPDLREGDQTLASTYAQQQLHTSVVASAQSGTSVQAVGIRHRTDWGPTKDQVMSDAKAGLLAVQATGPSTAGSAVVFLRTAVFFLNMIPYVKNKSEGTFVLQLSPSESNETTFEVPRFLVLQLWTCHRTNLDDNLSKNQEKYHHGTADTDPQSHFSHSSRKE
jgi:hypothetical protein